MFPWNKFRSHRSPSATLREESAVPNDNNKRLFSPVLAENLHYIRSLLGHSPDITIRQFEVGNIGTQVAVVFTNGVIDKDMVNRIVIHGLMIEAEKNESDNARTEKNLYESIRDHSLSIGEVKSMTDWDHAILSILSGDTVIFIDGYTDVLACGTRGGETRNVEEPSTQVVIRGPKEGFTESIGTNVALVRRRIKSANLWLEAMKIGDVTQTDVAIMYIKGLADDKIVEEVRQRLNKIDIDGILESGYIEQLIQDRTFTVFPTLYNTERPDTVAGNLLDGRVAIFVDGTPFVLIAPITFFMHFQSSEDYYQRFEVATAIRLLRFGALFISLFIPSIFVAMITYHQEMIPTPLLISLMAQRESVPFPAFIEAVLMEVTFEILREAGIRMPRAIGQAMSIVGALVLGQAAVEAGLISPAMVIVVSITGISSFATPAYSMALAIRLLRFGMIIAAGILGFYAISILTIMILAHLCALRSFGMPYMAPVGPFILEDQADTFFRLPLKRFFSRPHLISQNHSQRMGHNEQSRTTPGDQFRGRSDAED